MLMLMGSYLSSFQTWLTFNQKKENVLNQPLAFSSGVGGIGVMSSSDAITTPINFTPPSLYVEKSTSESVNNLEQVLKPALEPALESSKTDSLVGVEAAGGEKILQSTLIHPTLIQYEEALVIEVPKVLATPSNLKRAINKVLLSPTVLSGQALLNAEPIKTQHKPWFYKQVINQYGQPIRYPAEATEYANFLLKELKYLQFRLVFFCHEKICYFLLSFYALFCPCADCSSEIISKDNPSFIAVF